ncbi:MAG: LAGLIDADG family homing endonuclease [Promethearchaeota archaeon]
MRTLKLPVDEIVSDYQNGNSSLELAVKYSTSKRVILSRLKAAGIQRRSVSDACMRHSLDKNFFITINTESKAYWLGFLLADGNIQACGRNNKGKMIRIALQKRDESHLVKFLRDIKSSHRLFPDEKHNAVWAKFTSAPMAQSLEDQGWHQFKRAGDTTILENTPNELHIHLIRGLIDGDGCIHERKNRQNQWILEFVNLHKPVVEWVKSGIQKLGATGNGKISKNERIWKFRYSNSSIPTVLNNMYGTASVFLDRKHKLALKAYQQAASQK